MHSSNIVSLVQSLSDVFQRNSSSNVNAETKHECCHDAHCHNEHCSLPPLPIPNNSLDVSSMNEHGMSEYRSSSINQSLSELSSENEFPISFESSQDYSEYEVDSASSSKEKVNQSVSDAQSNLRKQILQIQADPNIPASEKSKKIQVFLFIHILYEFV